MKTMSKDFLDLIKDKILDSTKLVIKDDLGLIFEGTIESFNNNIIENKEEILRSKIVDLYLNQIYNTLEVTIA